MAARYLTALDFSDWHAHNVLRKHAKNRPLGQLECRYQYTQQQPLLSCRTVETDASSSGTRTYVKSAGRRSTTSPSSSVVQEQQKALRQLFADGRAVTSAPSLRSQSRKGGGQTTPDSSITQSPKRGRPSTSLSTSSGSSRPKSTASSCRSKATSRPKSSKSTTSESFMVLKVDKDMLRTRQTSYDLTNRIHAHWRPGSSNLNQGHYRRGQKPPDDVPMAADDWLTFGGATGEGTKGVVEAFANFNNPDAYYNIGGVVGCRVAQHLRKGGKIRIGINGELVSHDLRIKKWVKDEEDPDEAVAPKEEVEEEKQIEEDEEEKLEEDPESVQENPPSPVTPDTDQEDEFSELVLDSFEKLTPTLTEEKEEARRAADSPGHAQVPKTPIVDFPLNWDDQVTRPEVKVMSARRPPTDNNRENLCETHPVVFNPCTCRYHGRLRLPSTSSDNGYRIKQRPVCSSNSDNNNIANSSAAVRNRLDSASGNKVRAIMIDQNSEEQDQRLKQMSIEEIIQTRLEVAASATPSPTLGMRRARSSLGSTTEGLSGVSGGGEMWRSSSSMSAFGQWRDRGEGRGVGKRAVRSSADRDSPRASSPGSRRVPSPSGGDRRLGVPQPCSSVPLQGARDIRELGYVRPMVMSSRGSGARVDRQGSGKGPHPITGLPVYRGPGSGGVSSINAGPIPGDAHFIQISTPIRNPNASPVPLVTGLRSFYSPFPVNSMAASPVPGPRPYSPLRSNTPENMQGFDLEMTAEGSILAALSRSMTPSVQGDVSFRDIEEQEEAEGAAQGILKGEDPSRGAATPVSDATLPATPGPVHVIQAISIPTGNEVEEEEDEEGAEAVKGERSASQDQQIDKVAHLLVKAVLAGEGT